MGSGVSHLIHDGIRAAWELYQVFGPASAAGVGNASGVGLLAGDLASERAAAVQEFDDRG
ncbi:hypothetical protein [Luteococcus sp.]|uniref:hypothetical protein n=1 Tax=Luteococcus sp. TaxID=1969402 RepID=UPI003735D38E